jgi:dTMP kinase
MSKIKKGLFITFEGTEGAGKSTLISHLGALLKNQEKAVLSTREPGGHPLAEKIRKTILQNEMNPWTEVFLYEAARSEHVHEVILPALKKGTIVLCDRFTDSTLSYQSSARNLPWNTLKSLNRLASHGIKPHLTVLLDILPEDGLRRAKDPNRFEEEGVAFQKKVRQGFLKSRKEDPKRWLTLKVKNRTPDELAQSVLREIKRRFLNE